MSNKQGLVQVYTGKGKGKTTAAVGLAVRALGQGLRVYICQFLKPPGTESGETCLIEKFPQALRFERIENGWPLVKGGPDEQTRQKMQQVIADIWPRITKLAREHEYDLMILDELNCCLSEGLIDWAQVHKLIDSKHPKVELVFTGRAAPRELVKAADLVSEIIDVKHPYNNGLKARKGIEY